MGRLRWIDSARNLGRGKNVTMKQAEEILYERSD